MPPKCKVCEEHYWSGHPCKCGRTPEKQQPVGWSPVKDDKLIALLEKLSCLGNGDMPGNSVGNVMAQQALEMAKNPPYATIERESGVEVVATGAERKGAAVKVIRKIVPDDGKDGTFYRDGWAWLRERGVEKKLLDIAPNCQKKWAMEKALTDELLAGLVYNEIEGGKSDA